MTGYRLHLRANIQQESPAQLQHALKRLTGALERSKPQPYPRRRGVFGRGSGRVLYGLYSPREQRSVVKISYTKNTATRSWAAHGEYLQREHAQEEGRKGVGFNNELTNIDIRETLREWQGADDPHFFKVILSPDNAHRLDLQQHVRELMEIAARDMGTPLEWVAIDHHNTDHSHIHILIRGVDERGQPLIIDPTYIAEGFRQRSQQLATNLLGLRTQKEISLARERQIDKHRVTDIDRSLRYKATDHVVTYDAPVPTTALGRERRLQEIKRLKYLETLGLAERITAKRWRLNEQLENILRAMQLSGDIIKSRALHGFGVMDLNETLAPTAITADKPITGRVVGMGLEDELHDRRYILIEGIDGKVHYVRATESMVKARDTRQFQNGDVITLNQQTFTPPAKADDVISLPKQYIAVINHRSLEHLLKAPISCLDADVIRYVETFGSAPSLPEKTEHHFANEYAKAMQARFEELKTAGLFEQQEKGLRLNINWQNELDDIQHSRASSEFVRWKPILAKETPDRPIVGEVVASNERKMLIRDVRNIYYQVVNEDLGLTKPFKEGRMLYIRSNRPPGLEFSNTDKTLVSHCSGGSVYSPEEHKKDLLRQQEYNPNFFLKDKEAVESFVLAHQRRADSWVKWGIMTVENGQYRRAIISEKSLKEEMEETLNQLKEKVAKQPGLATLLTDKKLEGNPKRFTLVDKLLADVRLPNEHDKTRVAERLREQAALWQSRDINLDNKFEKSARSWLNKASTLELLEKEFKVTIQKPQHTHLRQYEGIVVAKGTYDNSNQSYFVLKDKQGVYYAFPTNEKQLLKLKIEQSIKFNYQNKNKERNQAQEMNKIQKDNGRSLTPDILED